MPSALAVVVVGVVSLVKIIVPSLKVALVRLLSLSLWLIGRPPFTPPERSPFTSVLSGAFSFTTLPVLLSICSSAVCFRFRFKLPLEALLEE